MSYKEAFLKANIQGIIALIVVVAGYSIVSFGDVSQTDKNQIYMLMVMVLSFYFRNTTEKDKDISNQTSKKE